MTCDGMYSQGTLVNLKGGGQIHMYQIRKTDVGFALDASLGHAWLF